MRSLLLTMCLLLAASPVFAQDALYDPEPPAGSAFVRVVNATDVALTPSIGERTYDAIEGRATSSYRVVTQGEQGLVGAGSGDMLSFEAGGFYTVAVLPGGSVVTLTDPVLESRSKALVLFYNLADGTRDLKTADGTVPLIEGVATGASGSRLVNGIKVDLAAFVGEAAGDPIPAIQLERGNAYTFIVMPDGKPAWVKNATTTR
jgi:alginate O-acetyltransferase complex protein AlgF